MSKNLTLVQKARETLATLTDGNGELEVAHAKSFIKRMVVEGNLMKMATVTPLSAPRQKIPLIGLSDPILQAGSEGTAVPEENATNFDLEAPEFDAQLFKGRVSISEEWLEDNIEGEGARNTVINLIADGCSRDIDEIALRGDTASANPRYALFDGFLKQATRYDVDFDEERIALADISDPDAFIHLDEMLRKLPEQYDRNMDRYRILTTREAVYDYENAWIARQTSGGDSVLASGGNRNGYKGVPLVRIGMFPKNTVGSDRLTQALLCDPKNLHFGIWRKIKIEVDRRVGSGMIDFYVSLRFDAKIADLEAVVRGYDIAN